ncbi:hypothetical protein GCM10023114_45830 [Mycolicibacterium sediminis]|uniref:N-acetyltransferase n=2 Tax=Mycolicibacterium sediminis TaxID=1286180 RepID=A0A7I7QMZ4_9MYCO|nr:hypothetical protein MSEDJ_17600 [Mycolicibacterium sediminis]
MTMAGIAEVPTLASDFTRFAAWDPIAECTMVMATPAAEPDMFADYHRGAVASYARFGVSDALDPDAAGCAEDTALFWALVDVGGDVVGGVRAKGPLRAPEESHAIVEWAGQAGETEVRRMIEARIPRGVLEMKAAWLSKEPGGTRHRAKMIARSGFHAMAALDLGFCMATTAAHILDQWRSSGGVVAPIPATPYPDARYETKMMWWDRSAFAAHGEPDQVATIVREMAQARRATAAAVQGRAA